MKGLDWFRRVLRHAKIDTVAWVQQSSGSAFYLAKTQAQDKASNERRPLLEVGGQEINSTLPDADKWHLFKVTLRRVSRAGEAVHR